jgi:hypothetical protein
MPVLGNGRPGVRAVIRHRDTGHYYAGDGQWAAMAEAAMQFRQLDILFNEAKKHGVSNCCEIVVEFDGSPGFKIYLPL